ncbi:hypothetical protein H2203_000039 [Taxawa tesnikishii (nom. ined.)]|nr:hypothetical protein H2203_000039 [Dothideales sp. JES 119]
MQTLATGEGSISAEEHEQLTASMHSLFTTRNIRKCVKMYFKFWHPNCQIIHPPSFNPKTAQTPLLLVVALMGALYSHHETTVHAAKKLLDVAELAVFSTGLFAPEHEMRCAYSGTEIPSDAISPLQFQEFQAAYLIVVLQYWAGNRRAKNRAMETRFSEIIKVARKIDLPRSRQLPEDRISQSFWIEKESRIRTMNIIWLMDCAFAFYQNYPGRLTLSELDCDLPCAESIFEAPNPFTEESFRFSRGITIHQAFEQLFLGQAESHPSGTNTPRPPSQDVGAVNSIEQLSLTVLDMNVLIHVLYAFINTHMTLSIPLQRIRRIQPSQTEDPTIMAIKGALARWRSLWMALRSRVPSQEWAAKGFHQMAHNFWLDSVDVAMRMEAKCEDKLAKLKVLLQDGNI